VSSAIFDSLQWVGVIVPGNQLEIISSLCQFDFSPFCPFEIEIMTILLGLVVLLKRIPYPAAIYCITTIKGETILEITTFLVEQW